MDEFDNNGSIARSTGCACTDRHVHDTCLLTMVLRSTLVHRTQCAVCLEPYSNLLIQQVVYHQCNPALRAEWGIYITCTLLAACIALGAAAMWQLLAVKALTYCFIGVGTSLLLYICVLLYLLGRRGLPLRVERARVCRVAIRTSTHTPHIPNASHVEQRC
tara:strand:- start:29 stop:511 length:483 start_codon:yes stop_codon:yes gene_type:complete